MPDDLKYFHFVHEAGHAVVGNSLGTIEETICFNPRNVRQLLGSYCNCSDYDVRCKRSLAGLLAHLIIVPDSFAAHLREAYSESIILSPEHSHWNKLTDDEKIFMSGAETDLQNAKQEAREVIQTSDTQKLRTFLQSAELKVKRIILEKVELITFLAGDLVRWHGGNDRDIPFDARAALTEYRSAR